MKLNFTVYALLVCAFVTGINGGAFAQTTITYDVRARIDVADLLIIRGSEVQWHHPGSGAAVGRHFGDYPTTISSALDGMTNLTDVEWIPTWPEPPPAQIRYNAFSSVWPNLTPALPQANVHVDAVVLDGRGSVSVEELPQAANDWALIVRFRDGFSGSAFLKARIAVYIAVDLVRTGDEWKYLDDGSDQGTAWREFSYNDSAWPVGRAEFGYGDGDEVTLTQSNRVDGSRIFTTYFRKRFEVTNAWTMDDLILQLRRDDGAVVYLNGMEFFRSNVGSGTVTFLTRAVEKVMDEDELAFLSVNVPSGLLRSGSNLLAVEIHQVSSESSDVSFDLSLSGVVYGLPRLTVRRLSESLMLSWPEKPSAFYLEGTGELGPGARWLSLASLPTVVRDGIKSLTIGHPFPSRYFRLKIND